MNSFEVLTVLLMLLVLDAYARGGGSPILRLPRALGGYQALPLTSIALVLSNMLYTTSNKQTNAALARWEPS